MKNSIKGALSNISLLNVTIAVMGITLAVIVYQAEVAIPREEMRLEAAAQRAAALDEERREIQREAKYNSCVITAYQNYSDRWDNTCISLGREADCNLPYVTATDYDETHQDAKDDCMARFQ